MKLTRKEAFEKIKKLLFSDEKKFEEAKLADGTIIQWEGEIGEGVAIMVVSEDGNTMPAPDGTHELVDGTMVTTVGGLVTAIEKQEEEASDFEAAFAKHVEDFSKVIERVTNLEKKLAEYESKFSSISEEVKNTEKSVTDKFSAIEKVIDEIANMPEENPKDNKPANAIPAFFAKKKTEKKDPLAAYVEWKKQRQN